MASSQNIPTLVLLLTLLPWAIPAKLPQAAESLAEANGEFAFDLYQTLRDVVGKDSNIFYSPFSISSALAMVYTGTSGLTKRQLSEALHFKSYQADLDSVDTISDQFLYMLNHLNQPAANYTLLIANKIFSRMRYNFLPIFLNRLEDKFLASVERVDFAGAPDASRELINQWVANQTMQKITNICSPGSVNTMTTMVLANAIYFKGTWKHQFDPKHTKLKPFYLTYTEEIHMEMMNIQEHLNYGVIDDLKCKVLELPYQGGGIAMYILLPGGVSGLPFLEDNMDLDTISDALDNLIEREVNVTLPKFKMAQQVDLRTILQSMGVSNIFDPDDADMSAMSGERGMFVSDVPHKSWIEVNHQGTTAVGAIGGIMSLSSIPLPPIYFTVNHPFMFLIREQTTKTLLFVGRVVKPPGIDIRISPASQESGKSGCQSSRQNSWWDTKIWIFLLLLSWSYHYCKF